MYRACEVHVQGAGGACGHMAGALQRYGAGQLLGFQAAALQGGRGGLHLPLMLLLSSM